jgi:ectoine hydroxylase-related dioxygenase (phytanoyl-CoA dioxygenase family)
MFSEEAVAFFNSKGYLVVRDFDSPASCRLMRSELEYALTEDLANYADVFDRGMVHNCFMRGESMRNHLDSPRLREATDQLLCRNAIVYAYQSSSLAPGQGNYGSRIHADSPRFIPGYRTNLGYILALDDFTLENGATRVLPGSHFSPEVPLEDIFERESRSLTCEAGDGIFFDARLYHRAGVNSTDAWRHAITINFCRPFMRTRFDFPRLVNDAPWLSRIGQSARKFLGYDVRMPTSLDEFYLPQDQRLYKPNQE